MSTKRETALVVRRRALLAALALTVALAVGCGEREEPLGELAQPYPVIVRGVGDRAASLDARPDVIVALDPGSAELLAAIGAGKRLAGVPAGTNAGTETVETVVGPGGRLDLAAITRLEPDLLVATPNQDTIDLNRAQRQTSAALYVQPIASIDDVERATSDLGFLIGEPLEARLLVRSLRRSLARVDEQLASVAPVTVFVDTGFRIAAPERSLFSDLVRRAKGKSVTESRSNPDPLSARELARLDPDVYLATSESRVTLSSLRADPETAGLRAVRAGRFAIIPDELVTRAGPRVPDALQAVARALHPDAFG